MRYNSLQDLIGSSSTRHYFLSLPVETQMSLHRYNTYIHTAEELRHIAGMVENHEYHCRLSEDLRWL